MGRRGEWTVWEEKGVGSEITIVNALTRPSRRWRRRTKTRKTRRQRNWCARLCVLKSRAEWLMENVHPSSYIMYIVRAVYYIIVIILHRKRDVCAQLYTKDVDIRKVERSIFYIIQYNIYKCIFHLYLLARIIYYDVWAQYVFYLTIIYLRYYST